MCSSSRLFIPGRGRQFIDLDLNADATPAGLVHLKRWKDPDKMEALHITVRQGGDGDRNVQLDHDQRRTMYSREAQLLTWARADNGASDIVPLLTYTIDTEAGDQGPYNARQVQSSGNYLPGLL